jgi:hypothetical protein
MLDILHRLWILLYDICRFRRTPQELPPYPIFMWITLFFYTLSNIALVQTSGANLEHMSFAKAIMVGFVDASLLLILTWSLLAFVGLKDRFTQTLSGLAGVSLIFSVLMLLPLSALNNPALEPYKLLFILSLLVFSIWHFIVFGHILRHTLDTRMGIALTVALVFHLLSGSIITYLFFPDGSANLSSG